MKITSLRINGIRNLDDIEMHDLGNIIVLAGPNGSGKSSILDAIRAFKAAHATYVTDIGIHKSTYSFANVRESYKSLVSLDKPYAEISLTLELTEEEARLLDSPSTTISGTVRISQDYGITFPDQAQREILKAIFSDIRDDIGIMEHIPSNREFNDSPISSVSFDSQFEIRDRLRRVDNTVDKFQELKQTLVRMHIADLEASQRGEDPHQRYIEGIKEIFKDFLGKEFLGVVMDRELSSPPRFPVKTPRGTHEIDVLSSGEKEILMTYSILHRLKLRRSIILFDEPDLHLHGALERKVLGQLRKIAHLGNQIWIATHSPELIGTVNPDEEEQIWRLSGNSPNTIERVRSNDEKVKTLEKLGANIYVQLVSQKIVYVEGESDEKILGFMYPGIRERASFIKAHGIGQVMRVSAVTADLVSQATQYDNFIAIRDRDYLTDEQITQLRIEHHNRLFIWKRFHIENYLLDPEAIYEVHQEHETFPKFDSPEEAAGELKNIADTFLNWVIAQRIRIKVEDVLWRHVRINPRDIESSLGNLATSRLPEIQSVLNPQNHQRLITEINNDIQANWATQWIMECPGRDILTEFCHRHLQRVARYPLFKELVAKKIAEMERIHADVKEVKEAIWGTP